MADITARNVLAIPLRARYFSKLWSGLWLQLNCFIRSYLYGTKAIRFPIPYNAPCPPLCLPLSLSRPGRPASLLLCEISAASVSVFSFRVAKGTFLVTAEGRAGWRWDFRVLRFLWPLKSRTGDRRRVTFIRNEIEGNMEADCEERRAAFPAAGMNFRYEFRFSSNFQENDVKRPPFSPASSLTLPPAAPPLLALDVAWMLIVRQARVVKLVLEKH